MKAQLVKRVKVAEDIYHYSFSVASIPKYLAGQYIELVIPHAKPDNRGQKRWFTLSSRPGGDYLSITTRYTPLTGTSSFKHALNGLTPDDIVDIGEPMGDFVLPIDKSLPLLFVAGGMGITPYLSILSYLLMSKEKRTISLLYAARSDAQMINMDDYRDLLTDYRPLVTSGSVALTPEIILEQAEKLRDPLIYLSGPEKMVEVVGDKLLSLGIDSSKLARDYFPGYD